MTSSSLKVRFRPLQTLDWSASELRERHGAVMTLLHEKVGWAPGETVQIADRSPADHQFNSVVLQPPEYDALEPLLRAAEPTLDEMWRYGETILPTASSERLCELLAAPGVIAISEVHAELFRHISGWIRLRLAEGRTIHVLGY